ncbi:hypothetical protein HPB48_007446 [Haemaphysalis longicornis]|uniref:Uncharacterized protein n=1 Tax=Haemaphysalis longicornis TaxID=44386 RepID=A0A9J6GH40_HAELO|nr:hypothetical protein HPB48_007446 [Haemaphysalis longicornis]
MPRPGKQGFNTGVMLMDLASMRSSELYNKLLTYAELAPLCEKYGFNGSLGHQDFFTLIGMEYPKLFYVLDCTWNRQLDTGWAHTVNKTLFDAYHNCPGRVRHLPRQWWCQAARPRHSGEEAVTKRRPFPCTCIPAIRHTQQHRVLVDYVESGRRERPALERSIRTHPSTAAALKYSHKRICHVLYAHQRRFRNHLLADEAITQQPTSVPNR